MNTTKHEKTKDLIIVGAGIAGLVMTYECLKKGLNVTLLDRDGKKNMGGLAKLAFGGMAIVDTPLQRRMGVHDSHEIALNDWHSFGEFGEQDVLPKQWADFYVRNSADKIYNYLTQHGLKFFPAVNWVERGLQGNGNSLPRYHIIWGTGQRLVEIFVNLILKPEYNKQLTLKFNHKVIDFTKQGNRVNSCIAIDEKTGEHKEFVANNIAVACGGICGSLDKVRENWYKPWGEAPAEMLNGSHQYADGLLHDVLSHKGAKVTHLDKMWNYAAGIPHPKAQYAHHGLSVIPCKSALWLDHTGKRIGPQPLVTGFDTNELCRCVSQQDKPYTWQIFNWRIAVKEFALSGAEHNPSIRDRKLLHFLKDVIFGNHRLIRQLQEESDHFLVANNLPELVTKMNDLNNDSSVKLGVLTAEIKHYDESIGRGKALWNDDQLRRIQQARAWRSDRFRTCKPKAILDQNSGPLIAVKLRLISRKSLGGIQTNLHSQVMDDQGEVINGLYAIGEAAGFGGGGASGFKSLEGTFLPGCILTAQTAAESVTA